MRPIELECHEIDLEEINSEGRIDKFLRRMVAPLLPMTPGIMTVDGFDGVGKSTTARILAEELRVPFLNLDDVLEPEKDCYLDALDYGRISQALEVGLKTNDRMIVEGCMVEAALQRIDKRTVFRIYQACTTRMDAHPGYESFQEHDVLFGEKSAEQLIAEEESLLRRWVDREGEFDTQGDRRLSGLKKELIAYHRTYRPHQHSDIMIKIVHR